MERAGGVWGDGTRAGGGKSHADGAGDGGATEREQFLITGFYCRIDFRPAGTEEQRRSQTIAIGNGQNPSALIDGKWLHRQFVRVEEGTYENGVFKFQRMWNGDETDWGLKFGGDPVVLRVTLATY